MSWWSTVSRFLEDADCTIAIAGTEHSPTDYRRHRLGNLVLPSSFRACDESCELQRISGGTVNEFEPIGPEKHSPV